MSSNGAGSWSARLPGFPPGAGEPLTTKCFLAVRSLDLHRHDPHHAQAISSKWLLRPLHTASHTKLRSMIEHKEGLRKGAISGIAPFRMVMIQRGGLRFFARFCPRCWCGTRRDRWMGFSRGPRLLMRTESYIPPGLLSWDGCPAVAIGR